MGLKLNWGGYITIAFILFAAFILYLVYRSHQYKVDLVSDDYYQRELEYQTQLDKMNNASGHKATLEWTDSTLVIQFPDSNLATSDKLNFLRPSNSDLDKTVKLSGKSREVVSFASLKTGLYKLGIEWSDNEKTYYQEEQIMVP